MFACHHDWEEAAGTFAPGLLGSHCRFCMVVVDIAFEVERHCYTVVVVGTAFEVERLQRCSSCLQHHHG